ncbi:hypothetical protein [Methanosarcina sp.]|uniref:hypothetical protein n=1 Tax=Methanosarcina sp. TaxID=2213 RepID=UPI002ABC3543|nr:hypothetical protein [Methanosarcina sp.]MDY9927098.1 hypothetical protein [Methanosarcina sp.]
MITRKFSEAKKSHSKGPQTAVSNPCFHSKIIEKYSPGKKKSFSFPFLLFRKGAGEKYIQENRLSFPIYFQVLKYLVSPETISREFAERKAIASNQPLKPILLKEREILRLYENVPKNKNFYPVSGSLTDVNLVNIVRKKTPEENFPHSSIVSRLVESSVFRPYVSHHGKRSLKPASQTYLGNKTAGESLKIPFPSRKRISKLKRASMESVASGTILPDKNLVYGDASALNFTPLSKLKVNLKPLFIMPSDPAFNSGFILNSSSGKESYNQVSELIFNNTGSLSQELEREMKTIKEELAQAEKAARTNYSSIFSKMEEELKRNLEINRISDQVIQQITMKLKIEKDRRGLL